MATSSLIFIGMRRHSLNLLINIYQTTLNELKDYQITQIKKKNKLILFYHNLLKRTIFFAFYSNNLRQNIPSNTEGTTTLHSKDIFYNLIELSPFSMIADIFFPLNSEIVELFKRERKEFINIALRKLIQNFSWELSQNDDSEESKQIITPGIFELLYHKKKTQNHGVVYTPYHLAHWIVKISLQRHLAKVLKLSNFSIDNISRLNSEKKHVLKDYISKIHILDISVGCGAFFLASLKCLLTLFNHLSSEEGNSFTNMKKILLNNLFGVDIDEKALNVCRIQIYFLLLQEKPLLEFSKIVEIINNLNLKTGNSLVGFISNPDRENIFDKDGYNDLLFQKITYENNDKHRYVQEKGIFHWFLEFPKVFKASENSGFDIIIGNPPYIGYRYISKSVKHILKHFYPRIYTGLNDYYYYFIWRSKQLLAPNGDSALIVARYFLEARYAHKLRSQLFGSNFVDVIIDFREFKIFSKGINTVILFLNNTSKFNQRCRMLILKQYKIPLQSLLQNLEIILETLSPRSNHIFHSFWINNAEVKNDKLLFVSPALRTIITKIDNQSISLEKVCDIGTGYHSGKDMIFSPLIKEKEGELTAIITHKGKKLYFPLEKEIVKEIVKTQDILPFTITWSSKFVILARRGLNINEFPLTKKYLEQFQDILIERYEVKKKLAKWYEIAQVRNFKLFNAKLKIFCPYRARTPRFAIDRNKRFSSIDCTSLVLKKSSSLNIYYILGVLNSELIEYYLYAIAKKIDARKIELYPKTISKIPLKIPQKKRDIILADKIAGNTLKIIKILESQNFTSKQHQLLIKYGKKGFAMIYSGRKELNKLIDTNDILVYQLYGVDSQKEVLKREIVHPPA